MNRSTKRVVITSIVGGLLSGAVKIGWKLSFRLEHRNVRKKPHSMTLLNQVGLPDSIKNNLSL